MNCKKLNIELCLACKSNSAHCWIGGWIADFKSASRLYTPEGFIEFIIQYLEKDYDQEYNCSFYFLSALEIYSPEIYNKIVKLSILL
jgi:hypothetical protein